MFKTIKLIVMAALCLNFSAEAQQPTQQKQKPITAKTDTSKTRKDTINLNEIQIIGYGQTTKKLNTGSVSSISAKQIEQQPVTNVLSALSGRMAGVFVQTTNGLPGGNINIQIRGKGSIAAGTNPLYIVDGVPFDGSSPNAATSAIVLNNIVGTNSPLNNLNPADIESITILKDADATSIYGSRGSNGVVLITTKKPKSGNTRFDANLSTGISWAANKPSILSLEQYLQMRKEAFANDNLTPSSDPLSPNYAPDLTLWSQTQRTDWYDYLFGNTAQSTNVQARISGGKDNTTFSVSGNYHQENTVLPGYNNYQRGGLTAQFNHRSVNDKFNIGLSYQMTQQLNDLSNPTTGMSSGFLLAPNYPLYLPDGSLNWQSGNITAFTNARSKAKTYNAITNLKLQYKILPQLNLGLNSGYTRTSYDQVLIFPTSSLTPGAINYTNFGKNTAQSFILEPQLDYKIKLQTSSFTFLAGATFQNNTVENQFLKASNYKLESLMEDLASAATIDSRISAYLPYNYTSVFGRLTYNLMDSYVVNATIRRDGSSRFGPGNRYGNFGSIGVAWIFSDLQLFKEQLPFLSHGKIRGSYGTTGNDQIGDYQFLSTYSSPGTTLYQDVAIVKPNRINNANFHWETTRKADLAIELGFINDRIFLTADYYINRSGNQLVNYALPQITGFQSYQANLPAVIENKGLELTLDAKMISSKKFSWTSTFNLTLPKNKLKSFQNFESSSYANTYELGYDITRIKGYKYLGVDPNTGLAQYAGQNGQPSPTPYQNFTLGKATPDYYGGFGNSFKYGNLSLDVFAQFVKQKGMGALLYAPGNFSFNNFSIVQDRWSPSNKTASFPKANTAYDFYLTGSSLNVFDTSYLRIKNISLSYSFANSLLKKLKIESLRLYAEAQNPFTFVSNSAAVLDPESGGNASSIAKNFPPLKSVVFGLQFTL